MRWLAAIAVMLVATPADADRVRARSRGPAFSGVVFQASFSTTGCITSPVADTGQAITVTRASSATVVIGGVLTTCSANQLRVNEDGALVEPGRTNYLLNSATPADQSVTLSTGAHCAWSDGGSLTVTAGTATVSGLPCSATSACQCPFTVSAGGTVSVDETGTTRFQLENGADRTSFIATTGTSAARATDVIRSTDARFANINAEGCASVTVYTPTASMNNANVLDILGGPIYLTGTYPNLSYANFDGSSAVTLTAVGAISAPQQVRIGWSSAGRTMATSSGSNTGAYNVRTFGTTLGIGGHASSTTTPLTGYLKNITIGRRASGCPL